MSNLIDLFKSIRLVEINSIGGTNQQNPEQNSPRGTLQPV